MARPYKFHCCMEICGGDKKEKWQPVAINHFQNETQNVIPLGFEPKTHSLEGCCSIQLSYGTRYHFGVKPKISCKFTK